MFTLSVIIPAAGSGSRMRSDVPKPFIKLHQKTILEYTVEAFKKVEQVQRIIIPTSGPELESARALFRDGSSVNDSKPEILCIEGGSERQHSISNAMQFVGDVDLVAIHDAVRPFIMVKDILECCEAAQNTGAAILAVKARDTVKMADGSGNITETLERDKVWLAQTPQVFKKNILLQAYREAVKLKKVFTDDASLVEQAGFPVKVIPGDDRNFKITYPDDIYRAKTIIEDLWQK
ncbi:MAG: 2-C-methyl-D-erythritol 4-phosphate cytidylyltransferase [Balneolales bacterium]